MFFCALHTSKSLTAILKERFQFWIFLKHSKVSKPLFSLQHYGLLHVTFFLYKKRVWEALSKVTVHCKQCLYAKKYTGSICLLSYPSLFHPSSLSFCPSTHTFYLHLSPLVFSQNGNPEAEELVYSHYVICNDTHETLRFGQVDTDENVLLASLHSHQYSWRSHKSPQVAHSHKHKVHTPRLGNIWWPTAQWVFFLE